MVGMTFSNQWTHSDRARTVLLTDGADAPWTLVRVRVWDRVLGSLHSLSLDAQLAAGESPATHRLRAVRAAMLVRPALRHQLARGYQDLLVRRHSAVPPRTSEVRAAHDEIEQLTAALRAEEPVDPRGVALAALLLTDAAGPLYSPGHPSSVRDEIRSALQLLQPSWAPNS